MWNCCDIEKGYLEGDFCRLFTHLARDLFLKLCRWDDYLTGVDVFDKLEHKERLFAIQYVTSHLATSGGDAPAARIWSDVTIHAIFMNFHKIGDTQGQVALMRLVVSVLKEMELESEGIEGDLSNLSFLILWDSDWDLEKVMDLSPRDYEVTISLLGIEHDYYIDSHPDLVGEIGDWYKTMAVTI